MQKNLCCARLAGLLLSCAMVQAVVAGATIERYQGDRDKEAVSKILRANPSLTYESMGKPEGTTEKHLESPNYITNVLRVDDKTVGFINYCAFNREVLTFHIDRHGFINILGVDAEYRRKGYGRQLLNNALAELKELGVPYVFLNVKRENTAAQNLYESAGFTCTTPAELREKIPSFTYECYFDIPAEELPQGNLIQRYPRTSLAEAAVLGLFFWKRPWAITLTRPTVKG